MRSDKGKAFVLRREGKSYRAIAQELGVSKGTLSNWFAGVDFSEAIKEELIKKAAKKHAQHLGKLNRVRGIALDVKYEMAEKEALKDLESFRNIPLFMSAISAFWATGYSDGKNQLRFSSSDSQLLRLFIAFLEQFCGVSPHDLRLALFIHEEQDEQKCKRYWSKHTGIRSFHKTQMRPGTARGSQFSRGTATVVLMNSYIVKKMNTWIDHLPEIVLNTVPRKKKRL